MSPNPTPTAIASAGVAPFDMPSPGTTPFGTATKRNVEQAWSDIVAHQDPRQRRMRWWHRFLRSANVEAEAKHAEYIETIRRLERAVQGSTDGLWGWEFETGRVWIMPQLAALLGKTVEALPKQIEDWWDEFYPDDVAGVQDTLYRHRDFGDPYERQFRFRTATGAYRWFRARGLAYRDANGKALVMAGSVCDVEELFRLREAIKSALNLQSNEWLGTESSPSVRINV